MSLSVKWISYEDEIRYFKEIFQSLPNSKHMGDRCYYYLCTAFERHYQRERAPRQQKNGVEPKPLQPDWLSQSLIDIFWIFYLSLAKSCQCYAYSRRQLNKYDYPIVSSIPVPLGHVYHATSSVPPIHVHMIQWYKCFLEICQSLNNSTLMCCLWKVTREHRRTP